MKRYLIIIFCLVLNSVVTSAQISGPHIIPDTMAKRCHVKTAIQRKKYNKRISYVAETYDTAGRVTESTELDSNKTQLFNELFYYNDKGQLYITRDGGLADTLFYNKHGQEIGGRKIKNRYDGKGRLVVMRTTTEFDWDMKTRPYKTNYFYDSVGHLVTTKTYVSHALSNTSLFNYNDKGQLVKETDSFFNTPKPKKGATDYFEPAITLTELEITYAYDDKGLFLKLTLTSKPGTSVDEYTYSYTFY
jgi:hypothetical protein